MDKIRKYLRKIKKYLTGNTTFVTNKIYMRKYNKSSFVDGHCKSKQQYEASITRLYHTVEKGLSYENYKPGFGKDKLQLLVQSMSEYAAQYDITEFFYQTALCCLNEYIIKNKKYGHIDSSLENKIKQLPGAANKYGGSVYFTPYTSDEIGRLNYEEFVKSRHSIRHFSENPVSTDALIKAIKLAQYTPSACNRQGWKTRIIASRETVECILSNQYGNKGFGQEIDKLLLITSDVRYFNRDREVFQAFIDGGMYAESVINSLYYYGIGCIPLSASLTRTQENNIRNAIGLDDEEVLILIIGVGNYPEGKILTARSERKPVDVQVI